MANRVVKYKRGYVTDSKGEAVLSQLDAWKKESECGYGIDWCDNTLHLPANDSADPTINYPTKIETIVVLPNTIKLRITVELPTGIVVKEVTLA